MEIGSINEVSNCSVDRGRGGVITPLLFTSVSLDDCKYDNDENDGYIYDNENALYHN